MLLNRKIIALCMSRIQDEADNSFVTELNKLVSPQGYSVFVYQTGSCLEGENFHEDAQMSVYDYIDYSAIDVMIVYEEVIRNAGVSDCLIQRAQQHDIPVIVIGECHEGCINVKFDHEKGISEVVRHLIQDHKLRNLHFMAGIEGNSFSENRISAFKKVLEENNIPFNQNMISYGDFWTIPAERETEKIIASGKLPQAIVCANDNMAMAVCGVLHKHGIKVPEQVAVTGFDGTQEAIFSSPSITTVTCEAADLAKMTLEILLNAEQLKGKTKTFLVSPKLCPAESCGCQIRKNFAVSEYFVKTSDRLYRFQEEALVLSHITAGVQRCSELEHIADKIRHSIIYDMCCVVEKECVDATINPAQRIRGERAKDRDMIVLFDTDSQGEFVPYSMPLKEVIPHLDYMLEHGRVLIFTILQHVDVPIGYACFFYSELNISNYMKLPQTVMALNNAIGGFRNLRHEHYLMSRIDEMYRIDTLTELYNRRGFEREYRKLLESEQGKLPLSIVMADLDGLKRINDTFGHKEGDFAIHAVAEALVTMCPKDSICTRFGGDEMLAVCCGVLNPDEVKANFEQYFKEFNKKSGKEYAVEASIGIYITDENEQLRFEDLVEKADRLMYEEKARRKNSR